MKKQKKRYKVLALGLALGLSLGQTITLHAMEPGEDATSPDAVISAVNTEESTQGSVAESTQEESPAATIDWSRFPASYVTGLQALSAKHPNWSFVPFYTGLKWDDVIRNEMIGSRSLVGAYRSSRWKKEYYGSGWYYASEEAVKYCIDPRNYFAEDTIFQFEQLTFSEACHTLEGTALLLAQSFMAGNMPGAEMTYAQCFYEVGEGLGVSPFHLASRVMQEQGKGNSKLISGDYPGYEGLYNYYNISASGSTNEQVIKSGLQRAQKEGWTTPYLSIQGGADIISKSYIKQGQDSLYLQKFDVDRTYNGIYYHQYMQNIEAPTSEAKKIYKAYQEAGALENTFVFRIPIFEYMPEEACIRPDLIVDTPVEPEEEEKPAEEQPGEQQPEQQPVITDIVLTTGEDGELYCYDKEGNAVINRFVCDGVYTYYIQANGTAMRDRLTYHPDGVHVIYFDHQGHEVFSDFANVKRTITNEEVDDYCFFDVNGYLYVDVVTYDKTGQYLYYANPYGVMERGKWFRFSDTAKWADGNPFDKAGGEWGYATENSTLMVNQWTYDWEGRLCYMQGNGTAIYSQ